MKTHNLIKFGLLNLQQGSFGEKKHCFLDYEFFFWLSEFKEKELVLSNLLICQFLELKKVVLFK